MDARAALVSALGDAYRFDRELSAGVFVSTDLASGRPVVLKLVSHDRSYGVSPDRFVTAMDPLRSLQHANLIPLLAAGRVEAQLYYVTDFVDGLPLRTVLARGGKLPTSDVVGILRDAARGLAYAHSRGVCHGDITTATLFQNGARTLVADTGISCVLGAGPSPVYAAPDDPPLDHRADLYSLGVVAYELLTGVPPFAGRTSAQLAASHAGEPPAPVAARRPATPPALAAIVMRLLAKRPEDRPQTAEELLAAIDAVRITPTERTSGPVTVTPVRPMVWRPSAEIQAQNERKLRRLVMITSLILTILVAGALLVTCPRLGN